MSGGKRTIRLLGLVMGGVLGVFMILLVYGVYQFPNAPIHYVDGRYVGKAGVIHSREDCERLHVWERAYVASFAASLLSTIAYRYAKRRRERGIGFGWTLSRPRVKARKAH